MYKNIKKAFAYGLMCASLMYTGCSNNVKKDIQLENPSIEQKVETQKYKPFVLNGKDKQDYESLKSFVEQNEDVIGAYQFPLKSNEAYSPELKGLINSLNDTYKSSTDVERNIAGIKKSPSKEDDKDLPYLEAVNNVYKGTLIVGLGTYGQASANEDLTNISKKGEELVEGFLEEAIKTSENTQKTIDELIEQNEKLYDTIR